MVSRIELDASDECSVERVRAAWTVAQDADRSDASRTDLLGEMGTQLGLIGILLRVIDGGER
jgi:hypothetical protein